MKKNILFVILLTALISSCKNEAKTEQLTGVYKMEKQVVNDGTKDDVYLATDGNTQYKIYTADSYFYIFVGKDSSVGFGLGSYKNKDGKVEETNIYNGGSLDTTSTAILAITKTNNGYSQIINDIVVRGTKYKLTEEYSSIPSNGISLLDGVWQQTKNIVVTGKDTVDNTYNEYKVYQGGHFMWAARYLADSAKNTYTKIVGHGTFNFTNDALTEDLEMSSLKGITGKYNITVKFNGLDEYTQQTMDSARSSIGFKTYKRISK